MSAARATLAADTAAAFPAASADTEALAALLEGCASLGLARRALLINLASLPAALARRPHLLLIAAALDPLLGHDRARLFRLPDGHLALIWRGAAGPHAGHDPAEQTAHALAKLFADLPGPSRAETNGSAPFSFHDLPADAAQLGALLAAAAAAPAEAPAPEGQPFDPDMLHTLEAALAQTDVAPFSRRQPVCSWPAGEQPRLVWERRTLSLSPLTTALAGAELNLAGAPWLLARLTRTLDRRLLALLSDPWELADACPFSIGLNVASVLSPEFLRFDAALPFRLRGHVTLDLSPTDIVADLTAFAFARDFARARGYRTLLHEVSASALAVFPPDRLGVDLVQLRADTAPNLHAPLPGGTAPQRVVLGRVRDLAGRDWGRRQGITLFQGPAVQPAADTRPRPSLRRRAA